MPLPPALAAKLAKRGIVAARLKPPSKEQKKDYKGTSGCPNKYNIYHKCSFWCDTHWKGVITPDPKYVRKMQRLLQKYPLPHSWMEVFDKGLGRFYYWDMSTDLVSWLPPKHPKAVHTESAAKLREKLAVAAKNQEESRTLSAEDDREDRRRHHHRHGDRRDRDRDSRDDRRHHHSHSRHDDRGRKKYRRDDLDPMDPAAYSDIPQGTWSDGLENRTRADSTASGVLFQQRPYPAPGEVLASNRSKSKKTVNFGKVSYSS